MFADGASPIAIAKTLNAEHISGPAGRAWRDTTIRGHALRGTGILRNELYIGRLVWNRMTYIRDPATGRRVSRMNPQAQTIAMEVPELRIIDQELWDQVQGRLTNMRTNLGADKPDRPRYWETRRAHHVLTGKVICGCCGGAIANIGRNYLACSAARRQGTCSNRRGIQRDVLEKLILDALRTRLMQPEHVATFVAEFTAEWNRLQAEVSAEATAQRRELDTVQRRLASLIDAIAECARRAYSSDWTRSRPASWSWSVPWLPRPRRRLGCTPTWRRYIAREWKGFRLPCRDLTAPMLSKSCGG